MRKTYNNIKKCIILFIFVSCCYAVQAQNTRVDKNSIYTTDKKLFPIIENGLYGLADNNGNIVVLPQFDSIRMFDEFYSRVFLCDKKTNWDDYLPDALRFLTTHCGVLINGKWGIIEIAPSWLKPLGKMAFKPIYDRIDLRYDWFGINSSSYINNYDNNDHNYAIVVKELDVYGIIGDSIVDDILLSYHFKPQIVGSSISYESNQSYNVNVFDKNGNWYETGLLIESSDKLYIKLTEAEGRFELIKSSDERFKYEIKGKELYVK